MTSTTCLSMFRPTRPNTCSTLRYQVSPVQRHPRRHLTATGIRSEVDRSRVTALSKVVVVSSLETTLTGPDLSGLFKNSNWIYNSSDFTSPGTGHARQHNTAKTNRLHRQMRIGAALNEKLSRSWSENFLAPGLRPRPVNPLAQPF